MVPALTVPAVVPSVVSILVPLILNDEPIREEVALAASTVSCTLEECLVTSPPALAAPVVKSNITIGSSFFITYNSWIRIYLSKFLIRPISIPNMISA